MTDEQNNSEPNAQGRKPRFSRRFLRNALIASLALNLLVAGVMAGHWKRHHSAMGHLGRGLMGYAWMIGGDRGKEIRKTVRAARRDLRPLRKQIREKRRAHYEFLRAEVFDREAARAALMATSDAHRKLRDAQVDVFLNAIEKMTPEERKRFVRWRHRHWKKWRKQRAE